jgi:hypothetical protein
MFLFRKPNDKVSTVKVDYDMSFKLQKLGFIPYSRDNYYVYFKKTETLVSVLNKLEKKKGQ